MGLIAIRAAASALSSHDFLGSLTERQEAIKDRFRALKAVPADNKATAWSLYRADMDALIRYCVDAVKAEKAAMPVADVSLKTLAGQGLSWVATVYGKASLNHINRDTAREQEACEGFVLALECLRGIGCPTWANRTYVDTFQDTGDDRALKWTAAWMVLRYAAELASGEAKPASFWHGEIANDPLKAAQFLCECVVEDSAKVAVAGNLHHAAAQQLASVMSHMTRPEMVKRSFTRPALRDGVERQQLLRQSQRPVI